MGARQRTQSEVRGPLVQIETCSLPTLTRSYPRRFTLITRTTSCSRQLPSCVAVYLRA
jgi:hypothetical protein